VIYLFPIYEVPMAAPTDRIEHELHELLPLSPPVFFVLFALADEEKHGYRIMQEIKVLSDGRVQMGPATLYTTIQKLSDQSFIEEVENKSDDRRRNYRLTQSGRKLLEAELSRQRNVLLLAKKRKIFLFRGEA
jgi:DNA-binding PadR family transcriptional regulator